MVTREQVVHLLGQGRSYEQAAAQLGIPSGSAYLIATGRPADGSDGMDPDQLADPLLLASSQGLSNPPTHRVDARSTVRRWLASRVASDPAMRAAARAATAVP